MHIARIGSTNILKFATLHFIFTSKDLQKVTRIYHVRNSAYLSAAKNNKTLNDMAKVQIKSEKLTPFGVFFRLWSNLMLFLYIFQRAFFNKILLKYAE